MITADQSLFFPPPFVAPGVYANPTLEINAQGRVIGVSAAGAGGLAAYDDFVTNGTGGSLNWTVMSNGAGSGVVVVTTFSDPLTQGVFDLRTGSGAGGRGGLRLAPTFVNPGVAGVLSLEWRFRVQTLATALEDYFVNIGFTDNTSGGQGNNSIAIRYDSGNFIAFARAGGPETVAVDLGVAAVAGVWYRGQIVVSPTGAKVSLFDGSTELASTVLDVADLPGPAQRFSPTALIQKQTGTATRSMLVDYATFSLVASAGSSR